MSSWYGVSTRIDAAMGMRERVTRLELVNNGLCGERRVRIMRGAASGNSPRALAVAPFASLNFSPCSRNDININIKRFAVYCFLVRFCFFCALLLPCLFFSGELPEEFYNLDWLVILDLHKNMLTGECRSVLFVTNYSGLLNSRLDNN